MGLFNLFKNTKGRDIGFVINIKDNIPYAERREKIGNYIKSLINEFYEQVAVQYYHEGKEKYLTSVKVVGGNAMFKDSENEQVVRHIVEEVLVFFKNNKLKYNTNTINFYTPKPFKKEVLEWALDTAKNIEKSKK